METKRAGNAIMACNELVWNSDFKFAEQHQFQSFTLDILSLFRATVNSGDRFGAYLKVIIITNKLSQTSYFTYLASFVVNGFE